MLHMVNVVVSDGQDHNNAVLAPHADSVTTTIHNVYRMTAHPAVEEPLPHRLLAMMVGSRVLPRDTGTVAKRVVDGLAKQMSPALSKHVLRMAILLSISTPSRSVPVALPTCATTNNHGTSIAPSLMVLPLHTFE